MTNEHDLMWGLPKNEIKQVLSEIGNIKDFDGKYRIFADFINQERVIIHQIQRQNICILLTF